MKSHSKSDNSGPDTDVQLRQFPYPYRSMLAICSDLDSTPDRHVYLEIMRFLNTTKTSAMGHGVGLEVGNSIHFRAIPPQFSYWDTDDVGRAMIHELIHSGHIDCLHSFGERVFTRDEAKKARELVRRIEFHYTPKHGSWLNIAENELSSMTRQSISGRRIENIEMLRAETSAWADFGNEKQRGVDWQFTVEKARVKLKSLYPNL